MRERERVEVGSALYLLFSTRSTERPRLFDNDDGNNNVNDDDDDDEEEEEEEAKKKEEEEEEENDDDDDDITSLVIIPWAIVGSSHMHKRSAGQIMLL